MTKQPPLSVKLGSRLEAIDAYAAERGITRHAAVLALVDAGLERETAPAAPPVAKKAPAKPVAPKAAGAPKSANQQAEELAERRAAEARRTAGWFTPKGRK